MHDLLDRLRAAVYRLESFAVIGPLMQQCETAGANHLQIIGACSAGLAMRERC